MINMVLYAPVTARTVSIELWTAGIALSTRPLAVSEVGEMARSWEADPTSPLARRLGKSARELGTSGDDDGCPDVWELANGDVAVIGRDLTGEYAGRLPDGAMVAPDERLVVVPRATLLAAKEDIPDA